MTESMIERVARAIYHGKARNRPWEILPVEFRRQYHKQARAAIEAMREPTKNMHLAAVSAYIRRDGMCRPAALRDAYGAGVDAALNEGASS